MPERTLTKSPDFKDVASDGKEIKSPLLVEAQNLRFREGLGHSQRTNGADPPPALDAPKRDTNPSDGKQHLPRLELYFPVKPTDKRSETAPTKVDTPEKIREIHNLPHSVHRSNQADAMVIIPKNFDASKPINLTIYNHGWYDSASSSMRSARLAEQMRSAPPNTILVVPEWQVNPGANGPSANNQGKFAKENFAAGMMQDIFDRTPELKGKKLSDVSSIGIISFSAGYIPTESMLLRNSAIAKKVTSVTMLDSLYNGTATNTWIQNNIADLSSGRKQYHNIFNGSTANNSRAQADFVTEQLARYERGRRSGSQVIDYSNRPITTDQLRKHPIVFKSTTMPHMEIPKHMIGPVEEAAASRPRR
jgi:hypothetical protein